MNAPLVGGYALAAVFFFLWIGVKEDLAAEIERANTDKLSAALEAEKITREALSAAEARRVRELAAFAEETAGAIAAAKDALVEAQNRPVQVRTVIERVRDQDACIDTDVHPELLSCLRSDADCGEASPR